MGWISRISHESRVTSDTNSQGGRFEEGHAKVRMNSFPKKASWSIV